MAVGFIKDLTAPQAEDVLMDVDEVNLGYLVAFFVRCGLGVTGKENFSLADPSKKSIIIYSRHV